MLHAFSYHAILSHLVPPDREDDPTPRRRTHLFELEHEPDDRWDFTPEQRLLVAVLGMAIVDILRLDASSPVRDEALAWLDGGEAQISFTLCCERLRLTPSEVRARIYRADASSTQRGANPASLRYGPSIAEDLMNGRPLRFAWSEKRREKGGWTEARKGKLSKSLKKRSRVPA